MQLEEPIVHNFGVLCERLKKFVISVVPSQYAPDFGRSDLGDVGWTRGCDEAAAEADNQPTDAEDGGSAGAHQQRVAQGEEQGRQVHHALPPVPVSQVAAGQTCKIN